MRLLGTKNQAVHDKVHLVPQDIGDDSAKADSDLEDSNKADQVSPHSCCDK
jgi:hypothetical protein